MSNPYTVVVVLIIVTTLFLWEEKKREWILPLWLSFFFSFIINLGLKYLIMRPRPYLSLAINNLTTSTLPSFPSMHSAIVFSTIPLLDREFPKIKLFWIAFASIVAFSRLYLGVHYLSDIIVGGIIGYLIGYCFFKLEAHKHIFKKWLSLRKK